MNIPTKEIKVGDIVQTTTYKDFKVKITKIDRKEGKYWLWFVHPDSGSETFIRKWGTTILPVER